VRFFRKQQDGFAPIFFRVRRIHLFITTCIEKQCTRPLWVPRKDTHDQLVRVAGEDLKGH